MCLELIYYCQTITETPAAAVDMAIALLECYFDKYHSKPLASPPNNFCQAMAALHNKTQRAILKAQIDLLKIAKNCVSTTDN